MPLTSFSDSCQFYLLLLPLVMLAHRFLLYKVAYNYYTSLQIKKGKVIEYLLLLIRSVKFTTCESDFSLPSCFSPFHYFIFEACLLVFIIVLIWRARFKSSIIWLLKISYLKIIKRWVRFTQQIQNRVCNVNVNFNYMNQGF